MEAESVEDEDRTSYKCRDPGPPSSHIKDQRDEVCAFQTESGTTHNYESILGCHTLECSERALHGILCSAGRVENAPFSLHRVWAVTLDIFSAIKTRCFSAVLFLSPGEVWGPLRNRRVRDLVSLVSDLSGVMEHIHIEVRAFGVVTWLVAPFPFGTFLRAQDCRILIRGDFQAWCLTRRCLTRGWQECCLGLSPWA